MQVVRARSEPQDTLQQAAHASWRADRSGAAAGGAIACHHTPVADGQWPTPEGMGHSLLRNHRASLGALARQLAGPQRRF